MSSMESCIDFKDVAIKKLFYRFLFPTVIGMLFSAVFIITDGIFVGKGLGSDALAAVNLVSPFYMVSTGIGLMFGMGGSVVASVNLAKNKNKIANINITQAVVMPALAMVIISALILIFRRPILSLLGTPVELELLAEEYLFYFTLFLTPITLSNILMFLVRLDGAPRLAMGCIIIAALLNIVLDYLFIFVFGWGMMGAAVATGIGTMTGMLLMLVYMLWFSKQLHFVRLKLSRKSMLLTARNTGYMIQVGFSALLSELAISCMMIVGNFTFIKYVGKDGIAAFSIGCYLFPIIFMIYNGIIQAAQPIISYNHGASEEKRVRDVLLLALKTSAGCGLFFLVVTFFFISLVVGLFLRPEMPAYQIAVAGLPYFAFGYIFFGINVITIGYYQSIERGKLATQLTILRGIVFLTISFLVLPLFWGVEGIWLAVPMAELLTTLLLLLLAGKRKMARR